MQKYYRSALSFINICTLSKSMHFSLPWSEVDRVLDLGYNLSELVRLNSSSLPAGSLASHVALGVDEARSSPVPPFCVLLVVAGAASSFICSS